MYLEVHFLDSFFCLQNIVLLYLALSCSPPNLHVAGGDHLKYDCPSYNIGAECSMTCMSGYPKGGVDIIQCIADYHSNPPKLDWKWEDGGLAPFCKGKLIYKSNVFNCNLSNISNYALNWNDQTFLSLSK